LQNKAGRGLYLEREFRNRLFSKAYKNCGESLGSLATALGYNGGGRNGYVRNMWIGKVAISGPKLHRIARLAGISLSEVLSHRIDKQHNLELEDWAASFRLFVSQSKKNAHSDVS
jgi:hypothetical protein